MIAEPVTIAVTRIEAPGSGWVADAVEVGAIAQGRGRKRRSRTCASWSASDAPPGSLPAAKYRELVNLLRHFGTDLRGEGLPQLIVRSQEEKLRPVHCHPSQGFWPEAVGSLLRHLRVSREEF